MHVLGALIAIPLMLLGAGAHALELVTGSAGYRERIAVPPDVTLEVRLEDVSLMDVPATIISTVTVNNAGNPPYSFAIPYNPNAIVEGRSYNVRASLRMGENLLFTTDTHIPVLTRGAGTDVSITMIKVQNQAATPRRMIGAFTYYADAATFEECGTETSVPVAMEGAYIDAERGYLDARDAATAPVVVVLDGTVSEREGMEGGMRDMLVIARVAGFVPGLTCERALADAEVENTYWRVLSVDGATIPGADGGREPHLILQPGEGRFTSTVGCNIVNGSYTLDGSSLTFGAGPMTLMACPPPLDEVERAWTAGIMSVREAVVTGPTMELRDEAGQTVAFLEAVALP